jgi:hypothetical protein
MNFKENTIILGCLNAYYRDYGQGGTENKEIKEMGEVHRTKLIAQNLYGY